MNNKKTTGDYYRNIIKVIAERLENLENDRIKYGKFKRFVTGIDRNIRNTQKQLDYYNRVLKQYLDDGWVE